VGRQHSASPYEMPKYRIAIALLLPFCCHSEQREESAVTFVCRGIRSFWCVILSASLREGPRSSPRHPYRQRASAATTDADLFAIPLLHLFVIPQRSGGICCCLFVCHSERSEESQKLMSVQIHPAPHAGCPIHHAVSSRDVWDIRANRGPRRTAFCSLGWKARTLPPISLIPHESHPVVILSV